MNKISKIVYLFAMLGCVLGIYVEWKSEDSIVWPAIALLWCMNSFMSEFKKQ